MGVAERSFVTIHFISNFFLIPFIFFASSSSDHFFFFARLHLRSFCAIPFLIPFPLGRALFISLFMTSMIRPLTWLVVEPSFRPLPTLDFQNLSCKYFEPWSPWITHHHMQGTNCPDLSGPPSFQGWMKNVTYPREPISSNGALQDASPPWHHWSRYFFLTTVWTHILSTRPSLLWRLFWVGWSTFEG